MVDEIARIEVDRNLCIGSGICVDTAPGVFQLDDSMVAVVLDMKAASPDTLWEAARGCPTDAIQLFNTDGKRLHPS